MSHNITVVLVLALCVLGPSAVFVASAIASIRALGRNPSASPKILTTLIIVLAFAAGLAFVALLVSFQILSKK